MFSELHFLNFCKNIKSFVGKILMRIRWRWITCVDFVSFEIKKKNEIIMHAWEMKMMMMMV